MFEKAWAEPTVARQMNVDVFILYQLEGKERDLVKTVGMVVEDVASGAREGNRADVLSLHNAPPSTDSCKTRVSYSPHPHHAHASGRT